MLIVKKIGAALYISQSLDGAIYSSRNILISNRNLAHTYETLSF
jgi:hypothetical protein